jgi:hypothetical protein
MKLTRRQLVSTLGVAAAVSAQQRPPAAETPEELQKAAAARLRRTSDILDKVHLPMATEPAFTFKV